MGAAACWWITPNRLEGVNDRAKTGSGPGLWGTGHAWGTGCRGRGGLCRASQQPENVPPAYHDLAMVHHAAAEELARIIPTKDLKQILPQFNNVLKACVACHLEYKVKEHS